MCRPSAALCLHHLGTGARGRAGKGVGGGAAPGDDTTAVERATGCLVVIMSLREAHSALGDPLFLAGTRATATPGFLITDSNRPSMPAAHFHIRWPPSSQRGEPRGAHTLQR